MDGLTDVECFESRESVMAAVIQTLEEAGVTVGKLSSKYQVSLQGCGALIREMML